MTGAVPGCGADPAGRSAVPTLGATADENDVEFFSSLSTRERTALVATLKTLVRAHNLQRLPTE
jgi:hypothetical protein